MRMKGITCCGDCGYYNWKTHKCIRCSDKDDAEDHFYADCPLPDVVFVQEPRVMTLEEIGNVLKMPLWKETRRAHKDLYTGWVLAYEIQNGEGITGKRLGMSEPSGRVVWYRLDDYGTTWRCWTARPTEEQRKAVKWDEDQR